jgi:SAM-dependent methyltransferase
LRNEPFFAQTKARMDALGPSGDGVRVVDVGCGTGEDVVAVATGRRVVVGVERSTRMAHEARRRHAALPLLVADGRQLPFPSASVDGVRADRVLQHLADAPGALGEWRRVLRPGGVLVTFDPDLTTATVDGVDHELATNVLASRTATRAGAATVRALDGALAATGFEDVVIERHALDLTSLDQADGIFGLASWGATLEGAEKWSEAVHAANVNGSLRYRCDYVLGLGRVI